ncbi:MAG: hypothetical protein H6712_34625 [Myxococcales bacterium]|nr:hypothetical protein [Myxococcales bacterium]MCB9719032.1 hypothetical protein [Myxococcales bacterium]
MDWGKTTTIVLLCSLGLACGPEGQMAGETEGDSESEDTGTTGDATNPTATSPTTMTTASSMSGSATTTATSGTEDTGPVDGSGDTAETMPPVDTGECPYGTEGCLCDVGAQCDEGLSCNDEGICVAPPACEPIDTDPHADEGTAIGLDELGCDQGMDLGVIGTIEGPETDWYTFFGNDANFCPEHPGALVMAAVPLDVCVFLECANGGDLVFITCGGGSMDAMSPDGRTGCCGVDTAVVEGYDCSGFGGKDADVYISVGSDEAICEDYGLSYGF